MAWRGMLLQKDLGIESLYTVFYEEHRPRRMAIAEAGPHWECRYVERGELTVATRGGEERHAPAGFLFFRAPGETQTFRVVGKASARVLVIVFSTHSPQVERCHSFVRADARLKELLSRIAEERARGFTEWREENGSSRLVRREDAPPGCAQLLLAHTEELLLTLLPERTWRARREAPRREELYPFLLAYMEAHLDGHLTLAELAEASGSSISTVKAVFQRETGGGALSHFIRMKITRAEAYIKEEGRSATEIAALLGYESIHYFSRQFRQITGFSPSTYAAKYRANRKTP